MTTTTTTQPTPPAARPLPDCVVPFPEVCGWCHGSGVEPYEECGEIPCFRCDGCGYPPAEFDLGPSRTHKHRRAQFTPGRALLTVTLGRRKQSYTVVEFPADAEYGRSFAVEKHGDAAPRTVYHLRCGPAGVECSCAGETYQSAAKANQRAVERGDEVFPTWGCVHADALVPLVAAGWFDLNTPREPSVT